jgi:glutamate-1-semialdehyde 2,1-aminomutase
MAFQTTKSKEIFDQLKKYIAGGVSSNDRLGVDPYPIVFSHGSGSRFTDVDGNEYIDYCLGFGPLFLGHAPKPVIEAVIKQMQQGTHFGAPSEVELRVAKRLTELVPCLERVRFNQSGTEAVQAAIRIARAHTGKTKIIKFEGSYHGWLDSVMISYAPPTLELMGPREKPNKVITYKGQSASLLDDVYILPWNDLEAVERLVREHGDSIAAILTEPVMANAGVIVPKPGYLEGLRKITEENGIVLIFDEVITGFRVALGGAQSYFGVIPDLATFAKAMGSGFPVSCVGGKAEIMDEVSERRALHAGTYNSNPLVLSAVEATLEILSRDNGIVYKDLAKRVRCLRSGLEDVFHRAGIPMSTQGTDTLFGISLTADPVHDYRDSLKADGKRLMKYRREIRQLGVYTKPTPRDVCYVSIAHTDQDIDQTLERAEKAVVNI